MGSSIEKKKTDRFRFLKRLYEMTDGNKNGMVDSYQIGNELGLTRKETESIVQYLQGENLAGYRAMQGLVGIYHGGVLEVEQALSNPNKSTEHFPAIINIFNAGNISNSQIQQGTAASTQSKANPVDIKSVESILNSLLVELEKLKNLPTNQLKDLKVEVDTIKIQLQHSDPKPAVVNSCLNAIYDVIINVGGGVTAGLIVEYLRARGVIQ